MKIIGTTLNAKYIHTNLALRYLKAYAAPDFNVEIIEYTIKDPIMNIVTDLFNQNADVIGFSCYIWNMEEIKKVVNILNKINPNIYIVLGGPEVTYDPFFWLKEIPGADFVVVGEGESSFKNLLSEIQGDKNFKNVNGIAYFDGEKPVMTAPEAKVDLREMPSPFRFEEDLPNLSKRITYIETSRGCPFNCQFCLSSIEVGVRYFDREKIKEDIRYLMKNGARTIKFMDRTFNISRSYAMDIFEFLIKEHVPGTVFQFEITADIMRPEVIEYLNKEAPPGLFRFEIGVQSTNDYTNELVKRRQNFDKLKRTVTMIKDGGKVDQHLDLIAGLPEENYDSFRKTFNDVFEMRPEELQLGFLKMLRGTGLRQQADEWNYQYMDQAPYEIVSNNVMPFSDVVRIKQVEDVLEKYWNDHRMDHGVEYLVSQVFESPFDFFQQFGTYWEEQRWSKIGHQLEDLFKRLIQFVNHTHPESLKTLESLLKIDYLSRLSFKPRKPWWNHSLSKQDKSPYYRAIIESPQLLGNEYASLDLNERDIYKHMLIDEISIDISKYMETGEVKNCPILLFAYFDPKSTGCKLYYVPKETLSDNVENTNESL